MRVLLKLSGESLAASQVQGINAERLAQYASEIAEAAKEGHEIAIVIGGGNIFRGMSGVAKGFDRVIGDTMGMLATIINALALQGAIVKKGVKAKLFTAQPMTSIGEHFRQEEVCRSLEEGCIALLAGGTGNPFFTTDSAAALRAAEIRADYLLKGTRVDGIYTADPEKDSSATKYSQITFREVYEKELKIMDLTAMTLCKENNIPICVFDMDTPGNLFRILKGEPLGTIVCNKA